MSETHQPRQALQSVGALLAGMLTGIILFLGTDELLHLAYVFPPWDQRASDALQRLTIDPMGEPDSLEVPGRIWLCLFPGIG
jgi:hypothetical protein